MLGSPPRRRQWGSALFIVGAVFVFGTVTTTTSIAATKGSASGAQILLTKIGLRSSDAPTGWRVELFPGGAQVKGEVTLDLCGAHFPSEGLRVARRQLGVVGTPMSAAFSSEAVLYRNAAATRQAFAELRRAESTCPPSFVSSDVGGVPPLKTVFGPTPDVAWPATPGVERLAFAATFSDAQGTMEHSTGVYLRRGPLFLGLYWTPDTTVIPVGGQTTIEGTVRLFESRMASVPIPRTLPHS